jgi:hypothetical protein
VGKEEEKRECEIWRRTECINHFVLFRSRCNTAEIFEINSGQG